MCSVHNMRAERGCFGYLKKFNINFHFKISLYYFFIFLIPLLKKKENNVKHFNKSTKTIPSRDLSIQLWVNWPLSSSSFKFLPDSKMIEIFLTILVFLHIRFTNNLIFKVKCKSRNNFNQPSKNKSFYGNILKRTVNRENIKSLKTFLYQENLILIC